MTTTILISISAALMISIDAVLFMRARKKEQSAREREERRPRFWQKYLALILLNIAITISVSITIVSKPDRRQAPPPPVPSPTPHPSPEKKVDLPSLREHLKKRYDREGFTIEPRLDAEVVQGKIGNYYDVYIKGPALFPEGEYIIRDAELSYRAPLLNYVSEIDDVLKAAPEHRLYVKGSADYKGQASFSRDFEIDRYTFREIPCLKYDVRQEQFSQDVEVHRIPGKYTNSDLPDLRARFAQKVLETFSLKSEILQGAVTTNLDNPRDRNIVFLLFVRWPDNP
ncbi:MAG TPA: hypothetical protein VEZ90_05600 [Blastocatellia bacterium]|nr:hypothetical protein [Blastocatellia bacterium]